MILTTCPRCHVEIADLWLKRWGRVVYCGNCGCEVCGEPAPLERVADQDRVLVCARCEGEGEA